MILVQNEIVKVEYEEAFNLLYYERRGTGQIGLYQEAITESLALLDQKKIRFWLIDASRSERFQYEDQTWLLEKLDAAFTQYHALEKVAVIPSRDVYNLMATEHILNLILEKIQFELQYFSDVGSARDWLLESFREVCFFDEGLDIEYDAYHHWIYANWIGNHDGASVKRGCELIMDILEAKKCNKLLNDNRLALGNWSDAVPWLLQDYLPRVEKKGLRALAWVLSPSTLTRLNTMQVFNSLTSTIHLQVFHEFGLAKQWLHANPETLRQQIAFPDAESANPG
jgi:hypothetical protein